MVIPTKKPLVWEKCNKIWELLHIWAIQIKLTADGKISSAVNKKNNSEKFYDDNKDSYEKITAKTKLNYSITSPSIISTRFIICTLCEQNIKVTSLKKHLINDHYIRDSSSEIGRLESLMLNETLSEDEKINSKKSDNNSFNQNSLTQKQFLNIDLYECDICLGTYSSTSNLNKHKRKHTERGETKENFQNFRCRYFNSAFNKKNNLLKN